MFVSCCMRYVHTYGAYMCLCIFCRAACTYLYAPVAYACLYVPAACASSACASSACACSTNTHCIYLWFMHPSLFYFFPAPLSFFFCFVPHAPIRMLFSNLVAVMVGSRQTPNYSFFFLLRSVPILGFCRMHLPWCSFPTCTGGRLTSTTHPSGFWVSAPSLNFFLSAPISLFFSFLPHVPLCMIVSDIPTVRG